MSQTTTRTFTSFEQVGFPPQPLSRAEQRRHLRELSSKVQAITYAIIPGGCPPERQARVRAATEVALRSMLPNATITVQFGFDGLDVKDPTPGMDEVSVSILAGDLRQHPGETMLRLRERTIVACAAAMRRLGRIG